MNMHKQHLRSVVMTVLVIFFAVMAFGAALPALGTAVSVEPGLTCASLRNAYETAQRNPRLTAQEKVRNAVDTYLLVWLESLRLLTPIDPGFLFADSEEALQNYRYQWGLLRLSVASAQHYGMALVSYTFCPVYRNVSIDGDIARVVVSAVSEVRYQDTPSRTDRIGSVHDITLRNEAGKWKLLADHSDDEMARLYPPDTDFDELVANFSERARNFEADDDARTQQLGPELRVKFDSSVVLPLTYIGYDRNLAASYALAYSEDTGDCTDDSYNHKFIDYAEECRDCQNFVSQCVWRGFGGEDKEEAIEAHKSPMIDDSDPDTTNWWADSQGTDPNWVWTSSSRFKTAIVDNYNNNKIGVHGMVGTLGGMMKGDYTRDTDGHVTIVNNWIDHDNDGKVDFDELYVCAHTNNRRDHRLSALYRDPSVLTWMWVMIYRGP